MDVPYQTAFNFVQLMTRTQVGMQTYLSLKSTQIFSEKLESLPSYTQTPIY